MSHNYLSFKKDLFNPKKNKEALFYLLKTENTFEEQSKIISQIPKTFNPFLYGKPFFKSEKDFGTQIKEYKHSTEISINWLCHQFKYYSKEINKFLELKNIFESAFLKGNYIDSGSALTDIESISHSYWGLEQKFLQTQYQSGLEYNFKLLNDCKVNNTSDVSFPLHAHYFSYKVEEDISFFSYENSVNTTLKFLENSYHEYFAYRLNPLEFVFENIPGLIWVNNKNSILDKYVVFRDVLGFLCFEKEFEQQTKKWSAFLRFDLNDVLLTKIYNIHQDEISIDQIQSSRDENAVVDNFNSGNYEEALKVSKTLILTKNITLSTLDIFVKAHLFLGRPISKLTDNDSLINRLAKLFYDYLSKNERTTESSIELLTIANAISNFDFGKELIGFLNQRLLGDKDESIRRIYLYSKDDLPFFYPVFNDSKKSGGYLLALEQKFVSKSARFFIQLELIHKGFSAGQYVFPEFRVLSHFATRLIERENYNEALALLEAITSKCPNVGYVKEKLVHDLFVCYEKLKLFDKAIDVFADNFLINEEITASINGKAMADIIVNDRFKRVVHDNINLPIFISLTASDSHSKFIAYDLFMRARNLIRPTDMIINNIEDRASIYFLKNVANPKVFSKKVLVFKNSAEVLKERIAICQMLSKKDSNSLSEYSKEITEHTQRLTVQQRIKEIDQSMIYVDENGILSHDLAEINKSFNRFRNISELLKESKIDATGINLDALYSLLSGKIDKDSYKRSLRKTSIHFELFAQLYLEVRDKFLFSNHYGLDYYLSQRIRHGTIIGQLRKHFQQFNLVTSKNTTEGEYLPNKYWINQLELSDEEKIQFDQRMALFSGSIDKIILDLKDKYIQIKTEDPKTPQTGWFDYMYIPEWDIDTLYRFFLAKIQYVTDFEEFIMLIFEVLWDQTTRTLDSIRQKIETNVKVEIIAAVDDLEIDLGLMFQNHPNKSIFKSIADCRTRVQEDVDAVARWFNKSKSDQVDFTLADAFNTSLTIVNNINNPFTISFDEKLDSDRLFKGAFFTHFVDLIKIFITNIFSYYKENDMLSHLGNVSFVIEETQLKINFVSSLAENEDIEKLTEKINVIINDLKTISYNNIRSEGNSGFRKANNILKNVFRNSNNELNFEITESAFSTCCLINTTNLLV